MTGSDAGEGFDPRCDLDGRDLDEVRRRVVDPVLRALLEDDEIDAVELRTGQSPYRSAGATWLVLTARGEVVESYGCRADGVPTDPEMAAADLYDRVQDEIVESRFGWGQLRHGDYAVPPPL